MEEGLGELRVFVDGLAIEEKGVFQVSPLFHNSSQVAVRLRMVRIEIQGFAVGPFRGRAQAVAVQQMTRARFQ